jgi:Glycosyl transferase family 2
MFRHGWGTPLETIFHGDWYTALAVDTWGEKWELLVIDDGSTDATLAILQRLHAQDPRVKCISFSRKFGIALLLLCLAASVRHYRR